MSLGSLAKRRDEGSSGYQPTIELRNQPDFPAKQLAKDHARLERCSWITIEPERDLPPICFGGSLQHREHLLRRHRSRLLTLKFRALFLRPVDGSLNFIRSHVRVALLQSLA